MHKLTRYILKRVSKRGVLNDREDLHHSNERPKAINLCKENLYFGSWSWRLQCKIRLCFGKLEHVVQNCLIPGVQSTYLINQKIEPL